MLLSNQGLGGRQRVMACAAWGDKLPLLPLPRQAAADRAEPLHRQGAVAYRVTPCRGALVVDRSPLRHASGSSERRRPHLAVEPEARHGSG
jgi:hypothetical protein